MKRKEGNKKAIGERIEMERERYMKVQYIYNIKMRL